MGRVTRRHTVLRLGPGQDQSIRRNDTLAVEEPLEIRLNGESYLVTMRTPGHDIDLAHGLLYSESVIAERSDVVLARYCAGSGPDGVNTYNVLDVTLAPSAHPPAPAARRNVLTTSACGICGTTTIEEVLRESPYPMNAGPDIPAALILSAPDATATATAGVRPDRWTACGGAARARLGDDLRSGGCRSAQCRGQGHWLGHQGAAAAAPPNDLDGIRTGVF